MKKKLHDNTQTLLIGGIFFVIIVMLVLSSYMIRSRNSVQTSLLQAHEFLTLQSDNLAPQSSYENSKDITFFTMMSGDANSKLFRLKADDEKNVLSFLSQDPQYEVRPGVMASLIPDAPQNMRLTETIHDMNENYLLSNDMHLNSNHYYFEQTRCNGIPVFGAHMSIHTSNNDSIYSVSGALLKNDLDCTQNISIAQAESTALRAFATDTQSLGEATIVQSIVYVFNPGLVDEDLSSAVSYITQFVDICHSAGVCRGYFINRKTGMVVYSMQTSSDALNRQVVMGSKTRTESSGVSGNAKIDKTFDILGDTYNYFNTKHQLDSFNGSGATIIAEIPTCNNNASWNGANITVCSELIARDVISHEFQHAVTQFAVGGRSLVYQNESGALNESLSDIFAMAIDPANWTMGESTALGVIRDLANPTTQGHPGRLFSSTSKDGASYYCQSGDSGGVHINSGVFNHAFYLMVEGGTFNGCIVAGLGKANMDKAHLVIFRALKTYMKNKTTGNYKDMYDGVVQACNDLYQAGFAECATITAAMQATEMDQQSTGKTKSPVCSGLSAKPATCIGAAQPTGGSTGGTPTAMPPTTVPTSAVTQGPTAVPASPTPAQSSKSSPLRSSVSAPQSATGDVLVEFDGTLYRLTATLSEAAFTTFTHGSKSFDDVPIHGQLIGPDVLDTGSFVLEGNKYVNKFSSGKDLSLYKTYQVLAVNEKGEEIPFLLGDLGTVPPSSENPKPVDAVILNISLRLQGIDKKPNSTEAVLVRVGVGGGPSEVETLYNSVLFTPTADGIWKGSVEFPVEEGADFKVLVKGPKHTQIKICDNTPTEKQSGEYTCPVNQVSLKKGENILDFTGVTMLAGDLPVKQDGIVNSRDVLSVRQRLNKSDFESLAIADVNYDGVINSVDYSQVNFTLANRTDIN